MHYPGTKLFDKILLKLVRKLINFLEIVIFYINVETKYL